MLKFSRLKKAKAPISGFINEVQQMQVTLRNYPAGLDQLADTGYTQVINNTQQYSDQIDQQSADMNILWSILKEYAPYFTFVQYMQLGDLAHKYLN